MEKEIPAELVAVCERMALGEALTSWGDKTYEQVIELLDADDEIDLDDHDILVWEAFADYSNSWLSNQISSLYLSFRQVVKLVLEYTEHTEENSWTSNT